jgi:hypothetical protein
MGKSPWLQSVYVQAPQGNEERLIGHILPVRITAATQNSLTGTVELAEAA